MVPKGQQQGAISESLDSLADEPVVGTQFGDDFGRVVPVRVACVVEIIDMCYHVRLDILMSKCQLRLVMSSKKESETIWSGVSRE